MMSVITAIALRNSACHRRYSARTVLAECADLRRVCLWWRSRKG